MRICFDIDGTICETRRANQSYADVLPFPEAIIRLQNWKSEGHYIILQTARHMWTCQSNEGKILAMGGKLLFDWLEKWNIPYDEVYFGKPHADIFIDDAAHKHTDWQETARVVNQLAAIGGRFPQHRGTL